ncbi:MAG: hypothetical protein ABJA78_03660 [Ferruginibacter sp.]
MTETTIRYVPRATKKKNAAFYLTHPGAFAKYLYAVYFSRVYLKYIGYYTNKLFSKNKKFTFNNKDFNYFIHQFNQTYYNERCVEIPIVKDYLDRYPANETLEIGNVLSHYFESNHTIIDKFETAKSVINIDVVDYNPGVKYKLIVSISTIEHIGWDDYPRDDKKILVAMEVMKNLLTPDGTLLVTAPMGYNPNLDEMIRTGKLGFRKQLFLKRKTQMGKWQEISLEETADARYGKPFPCANILFVGIF